MFLKLCGQERSYPKPLLANYYCTVADEPALKEIFMAKGHAGKKPCLLCMNVILKRFWEERLQQNFVQHTAIGGFKYHTDASIRLVMTKLGAAESPGNLEELQIIHGFNYHPDSLACSPHVGVASSLMWDWFHCYLEDGLIDNEFGELMCALKASASPFNYEACRIYASHWSWPKAVHSPDIDELSLTHVSYQTKSKWTESTFSKKKPFFVPAQCTGCNSQRVATSVVATIAFAFLPLPNADHTHDHVAVAGVDVIFIATTAIIMCCGLVCTVQCVQCIVSRRRGV